MSDEAYLVVEVGFDQEVGTECRYAYGLCVLAFW